MKLAAELQKRSTGRTVYILDEPTTGLHFEDIRKLLKVINGLVDKGNSVIVIEHNLDVIKTSDWIIDMGPEGGAGGGTVVAQGTPEDVAASAGSYTGAFLAEPSTPRRRRNAPPAAARRAPEQGLLTTILRSSPVYPVGCEHHPDSSCRPARRRRRRRGGTPGGLLEGRHEIRHGG